MRTTLICFITAAVLGGSFLFFSKSERCAEDTETTHGPDVKIHNAFLKPPEEPSEQGKVEPAEPDDPARPELRRRIGCKRTLKRLASGDGIVTGRILDAKDNGSIADARVRLLWNYDSWDPDFALLQALTDETGCFRISGLKRPQTIFFFVEKEDFAIKGEWIELSDEDSTLDLGNVYLEKGVRVTIKVTDFETRTPLPGATIITSIPENDSHIRLARMMSDENGLRTFHLSEGEYVFWAEGEYHVPEKHEYRVLKDRNNLIEFRLQKGLSIAGKVVDEDENPIPDVRVEGEACSLDHSVGARTDNEGNFVFRGCGRESDYELCFSAVGFFGTSIDDASPGAPEFSVTLERMLMLNGTVLNAENRKPIPEAEIYAESESWAYDETCDKNGKFSIMMHRDDPAVEFTAWKPGFDAYKRTFELPKENCDGFTIDLEMERGIAITGAVTDAENGKPLGGVTVNVMMDDEDGTNFRVSTDKNGSYIAGGLQPGCAIVTFNKKGYVFRVFTSVDVTNSGGVLDAELETGGEITGTVTDDKGLPLPEIDITAEPCIPGQVICKSLETTTDNRGMYHITGITPDKSHAISAGNSIYIYDEKTIKVGKDKSQTLDFTLKKGGIISGKVMYPGKAPAHFVDVRLYPARRKDGRDSDGNNYCASGYTDSDGSFRLTGIRPGVYMIMAEEEDYAKTRFGPIGITYASVCENLEIILDAGLTISGRVTDEIGGPVAKATVCGEKPKGGYLSTETDENGSYAIKGLSPGKLKIRASARGYYGGSKIPAEAGMQNLDLILMRCGRIAGTLTGRVEFSYFNINVHGRFNNSSFSAYSGFNNAKGEFEIFVQPGTCTVTASGSDFIAGQTSNVKVEGGCTTPVTIPVTGGGAVHATVLDATGEKPVEEAEVYLRSTETDEDSSTENEETIYEDYDKSNSTDEDGTTCIEGVKTGHYFVWAAAYQHARAEHRQITVCEGETTDVVLRLRKGGAISGKLTDAQGQAVIRAYVELYKAHPEQDEENIYINDKRSDYSGSYSFKGLEPGRYSVIVRWPDAGDDDARESRTVDITGEEKIILNFKR
ncbi:MAG: carboxypeptidase regulatory-like domain-containing protein [Planctomycetota bacterium]|nr:MAG: carboxypeptidase regulatory-like domain-containing protein [Planctomycetota bacterium]